MPDLTEKELIILNQNVVDKADMLCYLCFRLKRALK